MAVIGLPGQVAASIICVIALAALVLRGILLHQFRHGRSRCRASLLSPTGAWSYRATGPGQYLPRWSGDDRPAIFLAVAPVVDVFFSSRFVSALPTRLTGRAAGSWLTVTAANGWSPALPVGPKTFPSWAPGCS